MDLVRFVVCATGYDLCAGLVFALRDGGAEAVGSGNMLIWIGLVGYFELARCVRNADGVGTKLRG